MNIYEEYYHILSYNNFIIQPSQTPLTVSVYMYKRTLLNPSLTTIYHFRIGALAKYRCERGYKMIGEALATCTDSGQWSGVIPECECE